MFNPIRTLREIFDVQAANKAWDYKLERPKLSPERRRELLEASSLETPRHWYKSWAGIIMPYWQKAGPKEALTSAGLLIGSIMASKWMIDMQVDFSFLSREVMDTGQIIFDNMSSIRPPLFDGLLTNYPELQQVLTDNPVLMQMLEKYPDTTGFRQVPEIAAFMNQSPETAVDWSNFLRNSPKMVEIMEKFPGVADAMANSPVLADQIQHLDKELGKQLWFNPETQSQLWRLGEIFATDFFTNWGAAAGGVVRDTAQLNLWQDGGAFTPETRGYLSAAWNSKDFLNIVGKFMPLAIAQYKFAMTAAVRWRAWTTGHYANRWMDTKAFHRLKEEFNIDNPDQRIQDDPYRFTSAVVNLLTGTTRTVMQFTAYSGILWGLANMNMAYFGGPDMILPGTMFWFAGAYAAGLTALTFAAGRKLPEIGRHQQMREANFRSALKKVQDNTNHIALNNTIGMEKQAVQRSFVPVLNNQVREINTSIKLSIVDVTFGNLSIPIPMAAGAFAMASGSASMGTLGVLQSAFGVVTSALSFFANRFEQFASMQAVASRLTQFDTAVETARYLEEEKRQAQLRIKNERGSGPQPNPNA